MFGRPLAFRAQEVRQLPSCVQLVGSHIRRIELIEEGEVQTETGNTAGSGMFIHTAQRVKALQEGFGFCLRHRFRGLGGAPFRSETVE